MKNKYQRMSKDEKKALIKEYKNTEKGKYILGKIRNVLIYGIISYIYAVYLIITAENIWSYIGAGSLLIAGCIFIVGSIKLRSKNLNQYAIKKK